MSPAAHDDEVRLHGPGLVHDGAGRAAAEQEPLELEVGATERDLGTLDRLAEVAAVPLLLGLGRWAESPMAAHDIARTSTYGCWTATTRRAESGGRLNVETSSVARSL